MSTRATEAQPGGNMEGKELRFGIGASVLAAVVTSNGATGSYNSMHDSYTPLGGAVPLVNMLLGEIIFGGLGTGLYSIIMIALVGLILAGLMIGRMPECLGKKIGPLETKFVTLYALATPLAILLFTALAVATKAGLAGLVTNTGPHGFTEILFAYASCFADPALCLSVSRPDQAAPGSPTCGPFGENGVYTRHDGTVINGTRRPFDNNIGSNAYFLQLRNFRV